MDVWYNKSNQKAHGSSGNNSRGEQHGILTDHITFHSDIPVFDTAI